jgi:hypothetical protein
LEAVFGMKIIQQTRAHQQEQNDVALMMHEHARLEAAIAACHTRNESWNKELAETKNSLLLCSKYLVEVQKLFAHHRRDNLKLNNFKRAQVARLVRLESVAAAFDDVSEDEFDRMERELRTKADEMETALQYEKNADMRKSMNAAAQEKKLKQIKRLIQREEKLIQEATDRIQKSDNRNKHTLMI